MGCCLLLPSFRESPHYSSMNVQEELLGWFDKKCKVFSSIHLHEASFSTVAMIRCMVLLREKVNVKMEKAAVC